MGPWGELVGLQRWIFYVMQCQLRTSDGISFIFILLTFLISSGASLYSLIATCIDVLLSYVTCDDDLIPGTCNKLLNSMVLHGDNFI